MSNRRSSKAALVAVAGVLLVLLAVVIAVPFRHNGSTRVVASPSQPRNIVPAKRSLPRRVERAFVDSYVGWLNGHGPRLAYTGLTARTEVKQAGQVPLRFVDGQLGVRSLGRLALTLYSGQATVVIANRQQSFPFTIDLLREPSGWTVEQITPPDFASETGPRNATVSTTPLAAGRAARSFATAYLALRDRITTEAPVAGEAVIRAVSALTDPLAETDLGSSASVQRIAFGPVSDDQLAATATVSTGHGQTTFSFLMRKTRTGGWVCAAFL